MSRLAPSQGSILIVEDDPVAAASLADLLDQAGYAVQVARDGGEALAMLREGPAACLILLDLMLPDMAGSEFREQQKQDPVLALIPVVVTTGAHETVERALALDAVAYFTKPYDASGLLEVVGRYC